MSRPFDRDSVIEDAMLQGGRTPEEVNVALAALDGIWIAEYSVPYEGETYLGLFTSSAAAKAHCEARWRTYDEDDERDGWIVNWVKGKRGFSGALALMEEFEARYRIFRVFRDRVQS